MAWKSDLFNFEDINLEEAMRQISRWYGVKVIYEQGIPKTQLGKDEQKYKLLTVY